MDGLKRLFYRVMVRFARDDQQLLLSRVQMLDSRHHKPAKSEHVDQLIAVCDSEIYRRALRHSSPSEAQSHLNSAQQLSVDLLKDDAFSREMGEAFWGKGWRERNLPFGGTSGETQ